MTDFVDLHYFGGITRYRKGVARAATDGEGQLGALGFNAGREKQGYATMKQRPGGRNILRKESICNPTQPPKISAKNWRRLYWPPS